MRRPRLALLAGALLWTRLVWAALSPDAFTQEFVTQLRAAMPAFTVEIEGPLKLKVKGPDKAEFTAFLDNGYNEYLADPEAREEIIARRVAAYVENSAPHPPLVAENIVPVVKDRGWLVQAEAMRKKNSKTASSQVYEELNDVLVVMYGEDTPLNIRYFGSQDLVDAGIERAGLRALAVANLQRLLPKVELHEAADFKMITAGGNYEASLLLIDEIWDADSLGLKGEIVVAVPARDVLLVTGTGNGDGVARLREIAQEVVEGSPYALTPDLFVRRKGKFVRFDR